jgi:aspartate racemase
LRGVEKMSKKILGVLGGMGPAASARFLEILADLSPTKSDREHPKIFYISDPQIPDRTEAILGNGEEPSEYLRNDLLKLVEWGSDILAVPCNTAHYFIEDFAKEIPAPIINIVEASVKLARDTSPRGAWLLSTKATWRSGLYSKHAKHYDYELLFPDDDTREEVQRIIYMVKANNMEEASSRLEIVLKKLWSEKDLPFIAACTELPLAYERSSLPQEKMISSLTALAKACIHEIYE